MSTIFLCCTQLQLFYAVHNLWLWFQSKVIIENKRSSFLQWVGVFLFWFNLFCGTSSSHWNSIHAHASKCDIKKKKINLHDYIHCLDQIHTDIHKERNKRKSTPPPHHHHTHTPWLSESILACMTKTEGLQRKLLDWIWHWKWQVTSEPLSEAVRRANDQRPPRQMLSNTSRKEMTSGTKMTAPTTTLILLKKQRTGHWEKESLHSPSGFRFRGQRPYHFHLNLSIYFCNLHFLFPFSFYFIFWQCLIPIAMSVDSQTYSYNTCGLIISFMIIFIRICNAYYVILYWSSWDDSQIWIKDYEVWIIFVFSVLSTKLIVAFSAAVQISTLSVVVGPTMGQTRWGLTTRLLCILKQMKSWKKLRSVF